MSLSGSRKRMALYHGALLDTFNFLINQSSRERLSLSKMADRGSDRSRKFPSPPPLRPRIQRVDVDATYAYLVALFCSNRRKFNYMILAFHEDTFCDNVQSVEKRGMKFRRPWSDRNLCCQGNNRNRSFQKVGNIEDIFLIFFFLSFISLRLQFRRCLVRRDLVAREVQYARKSARGSWILGFLETVVVIIVIIITSFLVFRCIFLDRNWFVNISRCISQIAQKFLTRLRSLFRKYVSYFYDHFGILVLPFSINRFKMEYRLLEKLLYRNSSVISFNDYIRKFRFKTTYPRFNKLTIITLNTLLTSLTSSSFFLFPTFFSLVQRETDHERGRRAGNEIRNEAKELEDLQFPPGGVLLASPRKISFNVIRP